MTSRLPANPRRLHRITLDQYHHLIASGLFRPSDRLVLLDGLLVDKMAKGPRHCTACEAAWKAINALLPADWHARKEDPIALPGGPSGFGSEPEPDIVVVSGPSGTYKDHHPGPGEIALVVEVADSTLDDDRAALGRYAWARIPVAWIVNLTNDTVEVYTGASGPDDDPGHEECEVKELGDTLTLPGRDGGKSIGPIGPISAGTLLA